jgi:hypothetical protein
MNKGMIPGFSNDEYTSDKNKRKFIKMMINSLTYHIGLHLRSPEPSPCIEEKY